MLEFLILYGPAGVFLAAFLAATLLPFSSEAALAAGLLAGMDPLGLLVAASAGNCLACLVNYGLGFYLRTKILRRTLRSATGRRAVHWAARYGPWSLLLSWLPIVGDPITVAAGFFRFRLSVFVSVVFTLRIGRYLVLVELMA